MFRFTIRDVLWLTVVAGLSLALWLQHETATSERAARVEAEQRANQQVSQFSEGIGQLLKQIDVLKAREAALQVYRQEK